jgi:hypothetical protein
MAFLGEEDAHPYGQNDLAVKIEKSTLHAPKVTVSNIVDGLIRRGSSRFGPTCAARRGRLAIIIGYYGEALIWNWFQKGSSA